MPDLEPALIVELLRQSMEAGRTPFLNVISDSMSPLIRSGDQVQLAAVTSEALRKGDIIVFSGVKELTTHRFWGFAAAEDPEQMITKGDRPQYFDQLHDIDTLVGLVIGRRRDNRLLDLSKGAGLWLNTQLTRIAALDIHLFSKAVSASPSTGAYDRDGLFATTSRSNPGHRMARRIIYMTAKMVHFVIQLFDKKVKDT
jgi:hypothetical protein